MIADPTEYTPIVDFIDDGVITDNTFNEWRKKTNGIVQSIAEIANNSDSQDDINVNLTTSTITIRGGGVTSGKLASNAVTTNKINDLAVTTSKLGDLSVTLEKLAWGSVSNAKLANMPPATIKGRAHGVLEGDPVNLSPSQVRTIINVENGANNYVHPAHTGDVTGSGALTIANNVVTNAKLADMASATIKGRRIDDPDGSPVDLSPANVRKIINVADGANNYVHPAHTGDVTGSSVLTIANQAVTTSKIAPLAVTTGKIAAGAITTGTIAANAIKASDIDDEAILNRHIALNTIDGNRIKNGTITSTQIKNDAITNGKIAPGAVRTTDIAEGAVKQSQLSGGSVVDNPHDTYKIFGVRAWGKISDNGAGVASVTKNCGLIGTSTTYSSNQYTGKLRVGGVSGGDLVEGLYKVSFTQELPTADYITTATASMPAVPVGESWDAPTRVNNPFNGYGCTIVTVVKQTTRYFIVKVCRGSGAGSGATENGACSFNFTVAF